MRSPLPLPFPRPTRTLWRLGWISFFVLVTGSASAGDFDRFGVYASVGGVYAFDLYEKEVEDAFDGEVEVDIEESAGVTARLGVRLLSALAVELHYEWVDDYDIDLRDTLSPVTSTISLAQHTLTANAKVYLPFWRVQPYILAGVGFQQLEADGAVQLGRLSLQQKYSDIVLAGRVGLGLEVYLTEHIAVFGEGLAVLTDTEIQLQDGSDIENLFYAGGSAGLVYRF